MYNNNFYPFYNYGYSKPSIFNRLSPFNNKTKLNWSGILNNTQKTLNIINQAIPVIYQIKPIYNNAKTIFKVMSAVKDDNTKNENINNQKDNQTIYNERKNAGDKPTFFL